MLTRTASLTSSTILMSPENRLVIFDIEFVSKNLQQRTNQFHCPRALILSRAPQDNFWAVSVLVLRALILVFRSLFYTPLYVMVNHIFRPYMSQIVWIPRSLFCSWVASHCWADLRSSYNRCCSSQILILVCLKVTRNHFWVVLVLAVAVVVLKNGLAYMTGKNGRHQDLNTGVTN